jgi:hypothetical protein
LRRSEASEEEEEERAGECAMAALEEGGSG